MREYEKLRVSQHVAVEAMYANPEFMLAADMGIGKTGAVLTVVRRLLDEFLVAHVLVVAPLLVAEETWPEEIEAWRHTAVLHYEVLTGVPERREQRARRLPELSIINKENLTWLIEFWGDDWPYDMVVIDEMSGFKNPTKRNKPTKVAVQQVIDGVITKLPKSTPDEEIEAEVRKAMKKVKGNLTRFGALCRVRKRIDRIVGMTGTPSPNGLEDIWSQYFLLDQGKRLGSSFTDYRRRWFDSDYMGYKYTLRPGAFDCIIERIKDITISMKTADFIDMPDVVYNTIPIRLPPKVMKQYKQFEKDLILAEHDIEAVNSGVLTGKLLQLANGSVYDEDGNAIEIHSMKLDALDLVIEEAAGRPVLVAYSYKFDLEKLKKRYPHAEVVGETANLQKRWNAGKIQLLLAHPQSAGHGLNLQYGGCITVWYGLCWSLEFYQQLNKRLHRPGQENTVFIHHIVALGTKDEDVMAVLPLKDATQDALIEATIWRPE
jgi:hypothetical protein